MTGLNPGEYDLSILINPDKFICEGTADLSKNGSLQWIPTNFTWDNNTVYRQGIYQNVKIKNGSFLNNNSF